MTHEKEITSHWDNDKIEVQYNQIGDTEWGRLLKLKAKSRNKIWKKTHNQHFRQNLLEIL